MNLSSLILYVGTYSSITNSSLNGGIQVWSLPAQGVEATLIQNVSQPSEAGYLFYAESLSVLYAVDEKKTDGRGPVSAPAAVHAFDVDPVTGLLAWKNSQVSPGPNPTFLDYSPAHNALFSANHGGFEHVERVVRSDSGWTTEYVYDDSTVIQYALTKNGTIEDLQDVVVLEGHGLDPNSSPQFGGHAQASPHAHSASLDPSQNFLLVGDKGADRIYVYRVGGKTLEPVHIFNSTSSTGPRHIAWSQTSSNSTARFYVTYELSSEVASFQLDLGTGVVELIHAVSSVAPDFGGYNEPADIQVHPVNDQLVYLNNRGEDTVTWFKVDEMGALTRLGSVALTKSANAGVAARTLRFTPAGDKLLVADRPANAIRIYSVNPHDGSLEETTQLPVSEPAFVSVIVLPHL